MARELKKSLKSRLSAEDIDFVEQEALRGKPVCVSGIIQRIERTCAALKDYDSVREYLRILKEYRDKGDSNK